MNSLSKIKEFLLYIWELLSSRQRRLLAVVFLLAVLAVCSGLYLRVKSSVAEKRKIKDFMEWYEAFNDTTRVVSCKFISTTYANNLGCYINTDEIIMLDIKSQAYAIVISYCELEANKREGMLNALIANCDDKEEGTEKTAELLAIEIIQSLKNKDMNDAINVYNKQGLEAMNKIKDKSLILGELDTFNVEMENGEKYTVTLARPESENKYHLANIQIN